VLNLRKINHDNISVDLKIGKLRNIQEIFSVKDNDLQRGSLGLATNGNDDFYVSSIYIDHYVPSKKNTTELDDKRTFLTILKENTAEHRQKFCKSKYANNKKKFKFCREFHNYCKLKCDDYIHARENILNYNCYKGCVKNSLLKIKIENMQLSDGVGLGLKPTPWTPKEKSKISFASSN